MRKNQLFLKSSKTALNNSTRLYQESKLLLDNDHLARGFSLCVLTIEELAKAFLYRCVSVNLIDESKTRKFVKDHKKKITQSALILTFAVFITEHLVDLVNALKHDKTKPDHKDHTYPTELTKAGFSSIKKIIEALSGTHETRLDCLYVDIREDKIIDPNQLIDKKKAFDIFSTCEILLDVVKAFVEFDDKQIRELWEHDLVTILKPKELFS